MKKLLVDVDGVMSKNDFARIFNEFFKTDYLPHQIKYNLIKSFNLTKKQHLDFSKYLASQDYYRDADIMQDADVFLKKLSEKYDIYVVTASIYEYENIYENFYECKYKMLRKKFSFINPKKYVFTNNKDLIEGDIFIDDSMKHFKNNKTKQKLLFTSVFNKDISQDELNLYGATRVNNWKEIYELLK